MPTSYPGGLDALSNPEPTDQQDSLTVPHSGQHTNANDAIEAIQATLGIDPQGSEPTVGARVAAVEQLAGGVQAPNSLLFSLYYV